MSTEATVLWLLEGTVPSLVSHIPTYFARYAKDTRPWQLPFSEWQKPFLRVVLVARNPEEYYDNVSSENTEWACLLLAIKEWILPDEYSGAMRQTNCVSSIHSDNLMSLHGIWKTRKTDANLMLILFIVLWLIKAFVSDPGVVCILPDGMKHVKL